MRQIGRMKNSRFLKSIQAAVMASTLIYLGTGTTQAQDLDVPRAQAKYDQERSEADRAKRSVDQEESVHNQLLSQLSLAQQEQSRAERSLDSARADLQRIDRSISDLENQIYRLESERDQLNRQISDANYELPLARRNYSQLVDQKEDLQREIRNLEDRIRDLRNGPGRGPWTCCSVDNGWEEHRGGHCATNSDRAAAKSAAHEECLAAHASCVQRQCQQPDPPELAHLEARLESKQSDLRDVERRISTAYTELSTLEQRIRDYNSRLTQNERDITSKRTTLSQLRFNRPNTESRIYEEQRNLSNAQAEVREAQSLVDRHNQVLMTARMEFQREESDAQAAYRNLQQVIANYNAALGKVLAMAESEATQHSSREAQDRAPSGADQLAQQDARVAGEDKGKQEGGARDFARGYKSGRENARTNSRLAAVYQAGVSSGAAAAESKAQKEDFPLGYNQAFDQLLSNAPEQSVKVDITDQISNNPGENGTDLEPRKKPVGNDPGPSYPMPQEPAYSLPSAGTPSFSTPAADFRYRSYPCSGLQLPEFEPKCRDRYDAAYTRQFAAQFGSVFKSAYTSSFNSSVKSHYDAALARSYDASRASGEERGVSEQGILDGFGANLAQARARQHQLGQAAVGNLLTTGHLLIVRTVKLVEESGNGLFESGDRAKLQIVLDNYGLKSSPLGKVRVRVTGKTNGESLTFELRDLPALAANTRTTLEGVVAAKISRAKAQSKVALEGIIEVRDASGAYTELEKISPEAEIRFPLEVQELTLAKKPKVGEQVAAKLRVTNNSKSAIAANQIALSSDPATVAFPGGPFATPEVAPGQTVDLDVNVKPGVWVSDDIPVNVLSTTQGVEGVASSTQVFPKVILVERNGVLALKDNNGQPVPSGVLEAVAGQTLRFKVQFKFLATSNLPGPFAVRYTQASDPAIRPANNSTTGINYGSYGPGRVSEPVNFAFDIPQSMRGKSGYIMIQLDDGPTATHALQVGIRVR